MSILRAFISYDFDNNEREKHLFAGQAKNSRTPFNIQDWSAKVAMPESQWEKIIEKKIQRCDMVIVLVGKYTYTASGVIKEIGMALKNNIPTFGVYIGGANLSSNLPFGLSRKRVINWSWPAVASAITQVSRERTHAQ